MRNSIFIILVVALSAALWPDVVRANYIDPTTGGVLLQVIFGGLAGIAVIWKLFRYKISAIFSPRRLLRRLLRLPLKTVEASDIEISENGGA